MAGDYLMPDRKEHQIHPEGQIKLSDVRRQVAFLQKNNPASSTCISMKMEKMELSSFLYEVTHILSEKKEEGRWRGRNILLTPSSSRYLHM